MRGYYLLLSLFIPMMASVARCDETKSEPRKSSAANIDPAFQKDLRRLLELTEAGKVGAKTMNEMIKLQSSQNKLPPGFVEVFEKEVNENAIVEIIIPIYAKHVSPEDVKALIAFYESPAGKHFIRAQPAILRESMEAGAKFGSAAGFRAGFRAARKQQQQKQAEKKKPNET